MRSWQNSQFVCEINIKKQSASGSAKFCAHFERITLRFFRHLIIFWYGALKRFDLHRYLLMNAGFSADFQSCWNHSDSIPESGWKFAADMIHFYRSMFTNLRNLSSRENAHSFVEIKKSQRMQKAPVETVVEARKTAREYLWKTVLLNRWLTKEAGSHCDFNRDHRKTLTSISIQTTSTLVLKNGHTAKAAST